MNDFLNLKLRLAVVVLVVLSGCKATTSVVEELETQEVSTTSNLEVSLVEPVGEGQKMISIAAGYNHTCAVNEAGRLLCWGAYKAGSGNEQKFAVRPTLVGSETDWKEVHAGWWMTCAQKADGSLWCFASHERAGSGKGLSGTPRRIGTGTDWSAINVSYQSVCGLRSGRVFCVPHKTIVDAEMQNQNVSDEAAQIIEGLADVQSLSWTNLTRCAVLAEGQLWCGGFLGEKRWSKDVFERVDSRTDWAHVAGNCVTKKDGELICWLSEDSVSFGPLDGRVLDVDLTSFDGLRVGPGWHACGLTNEGWFCWGRFANGQRGPDIHNVAPAPAPFANEWSNVVTGGTHTCALRDGHPYCWGDNGHGQLGNGVDAQSRSTPTLVDSDVKFRVLSPSMFDACGIGSDDHLYCWGENTFGEIDERSRGSASRPRRVFGDVKWRAITSARSFRCGVRSDGTLWCWKGGKARQMTEDSNWRSVEGNEHNFCATKDDENVWCWMQGLDEPPIKDARVKNRSSETDEPLDPKNPEAKWKSVATGGPHSCAIRMDDTLWCWGFGEVGELGLGEIIEVETPTQVGDDTWSAVYVSEHATCGLNTEGAAYCWGRLYVIGDGKWLQPVPHPVVSSR